MTITKGPVHDYLGMTINYTEQGKVKFYMTDYIDKMLIDLLLDFDSEAATVAANYLFDVNAEAEKLDKA
eukprot:298120-Ditylum_brightwellii.AAC.1